MLEIEIRRLSCSNVRDFREYQVCNGAGGTDEQALARKVTEVSEFR